MSKITIQDIIRGMKLRKPVTVNPETQLRVALQIMSRKSFSQLPVVKEGKLQGMLSYKSVVKQMELSLDLTEKYRKDPIIVLELPVKHFIDSCAKSLSLSDGIFELLNATKAEDAVLIGETGSEPQYIITNFDVVNILERLSDAFLLIEQIESSLRSIIKRQLATQGLDCSEIVRKINQKLSPTYALPVRIEKMSWEHYIILITNSECWNRYFSKIFNTIALVKSYFSFVRDIRNDVFHFRRLSHTLRASEINKLEKIKEWLKNFE
jgi:predicted transcriptional regulator